MRELWLYVWAVVGNWFAGYWVVTAIPEALSYIVPSESSERAMARFDQWVSPDTRQHLYRLLFIAGLFVAGFMAWDEQYQIAITKSPEALTAQIDSLTKQIAPLQTYKEVHEAEEYPALTDSQQKDWSTALMPYSGTIEDIEIIAQDSRSELFIDSLMKVLKNGDFPEPKVLHGEVKNGVMVISNSIELDTAVTNLFQGLGYKMATPKAAEVPKGEFERKHLLQIYIGRRPQ